MYVHIWYAVQQCALLRICYMLCNTCWECESKRNKDKKKPNTYPDMWRTVCIWSSRIATSSWCYTVGWIMSKPVLQELAELRKWVLVPQQWCFVREMSQVVSCWTVIFSSQKGREISSTYLYWLFHYRQTADDLLATTNRRQGSNSTP